MTTSTLLPTRNRDSCDSSVLKNELSKSIDIGEWEVGKQELRMKNKIGQGSCGAVYAAVWRGTPVAVKVLEARKASEVNIADFQNELMILMKLDHPNVIQMIGSCTQGDPIQLVMEQLEGNLFGLTSYNLSRRKALSYSRDIARGLAYLHNRSPYMVIHRDLKPTNLLLTNSAKTVKIADFGLSSFQASSNVQDGQYAMTGMTGTYRYMAPEVMLHKQYNCSVDIYSFAIVIFTLFESLPFTEFSDEADMCQKIIRNMRPAFEVLIKPSDPVKSIIEDCWKYQPDHRPTAIQIVDRLDDAIEMSRKRRHFEFLCF